jgi:hypothetical protein
VRWLSGVHDLAGREIFDPARFEALVCWMQLPALIFGTEGTAEEVAAVVEELAEAARVAKYDVRAFAELLHAKDAPEAGEPKDEVTAAL